MGLVDDAGRANEVWLGTVGLGIVAVDTKTGQTHRVAHDPLVRQSLSDNSICALHRDRAGNLWVATNVWIDLLSSSPGGAALTVLGGTSNPRGLSEADVFFLDVASSRRVWAGLNTEGIDFSIRQEAACSTSRLTQIHRIPRCRRPRCFLSQSGSTAKCSWALPSDSIERMPTVRRSLGLRSAAETLPPEREWFNSVTDDFGSEDETTTFGAWIPMGMNARSSSSTRGASPTRALRPWPMVWLAIFGWAVETGSIDSSRLAQDRSHSIACEPSQCACKRFHYDVVTRSSRPALGRNRRRGPRDSRSPRSRAARIQKDRHRARAARQQRRHAEYRPVRARVGHDGQRYRRHRSGQSPHPHAATRRRARHFELLGRIRREDKSGSSSTIW